MTDFRAMTPPALRRFSKFVALATLFLIFAGAMVTSTNSGLAVPDWPLSYGKINPPMVGGIFYEHGHRLIASLVGLLTVIQAVWLQMCEPKAFLRKLGWSAVGIVILQGLFGGLTVLLKLPVWTSVTHAGLAELFLCLNVSIAFFASRSYANLPHGVEARLTPMMANSIVAATFIQILLGAVMRHRGAGLIISDFPLSLGHLIPPAEYMNRQVAIAFSHRVGAAVVTLLIVSGAVAALRSAVTPMRRAYSGLLIVLIAQITLGAYTIWTRKNPVITSLHVVTGALLLGTSVVNALLAGSVARRASSEIALEQSEVTV
jgi:cytochrome c oxidase assembly protein subunit 15